MLYSYISIEKKLSSKKKNSKRNQKENIIETEHVLIMKYDAIVNKMLFCLKMHKSSPFCPFCVSLGKPSSLDRYQYVCTR